MGPILYSKLFDSKRFSPEKTNVEVETSLSSDKSRVIFSSSFRRLQQKAQVFGLETNASVRSRLTHTLEVSNTGSLLAKKIADQLIKKGSLKEELRVPFIDITETCCLLHDIGNPPFGHFGEAAIKKWFDLNWINIYSKMSSKESSLIEPELSNSLINDFLYFDGNPQGLRICLRLGGLPLDEDCVGLNLTFSQILASVKYNNNPDDVKNGKSSKAGFFHSEAKKIEEIKEFFDWPHRFPITYIMEAADDISYCLSDIEDGIEKGIITPAIFFEKLFSEEIIKNFNYKKFEVEETKKNTKHDFFIFKIKLCRSLINIASNLYIKNEDLIQKGCLKDLIKEDTDAYGILKALKNFSRKYLFRSKEAENIELAGYKIILGLLESFRPLLELSHEDFQDLVKAKRELTPLENKKLDMEWRLYNRLPDKHCIAYHNTITQMDLKDKTFCYLEWYNRAHLVVDYISGMTDTYALETYRLLNGITI